MRVRVRDELRRTVGEAEIDLRAQPDAVAVGSGNDASRVELTWDRAFDEAGRLVRCPVCGCRELFVRRDFPQRLGLGVVIVAAVASTAAFALGHVILAGLILLAAVVIDALVLLFTRRCVVCYRCRSEFRGLEIAPSLEPWDLAVGEKYRVLEDAQADGSTSTTTVSSRSKAQGEST